MNANRYWSHERQPRMEPLATGDDTAEATSGAKNDRYRSHEQQQVNTGATSKQQELPKPQTTAWTSHWSHDDDRRYWRHARQEILEPQTTTAMSDILEPLEPQAIGRYRRLEPRTTDTGVTSDRQILETGATTTGATNDRYWGHERQEMILEPQQERQPPLEPQDDKMTDSTGA